MICSYLSASQISMRSLSLSSTVKHLEHSSVTLLFWILPPAIEVCCHPISLIIYQVNKSFGKFHYLLCQTITFWEIKWNAGAVPLFLFSLFKKNRQSPPQQQPFSYIINKTAILVCWIFTDFIFYSWLVFTCLNLKMVVWRSLNNDSNTTSEIQLLIFLFCS